MKISKLFAITLQSKTRLIFFAIACTYNLLLGLYLKDFLVLSPTLTVFYLLSVLPTLFLIVAIKTKAMRAVVYISLTLIACMNFSYAVYCRRLFPFLALIPLGIVLVYFIAFANKNCKDNLLTKIYVLIVSALIIALLFTAYIFVYKQDDVSLTNGQATLWNTATVKLADEICVDCDTDAEKVKATHESPGIGRRLLDIWQNRIFENGSKKDASITVTKKGIIWPLIVLETDISKYDDEYEDLFDIGVYEEVTRRYQTVIDDCCERVDFFTKILYDYREFKSVKKNSKEKNIDFIQTTWEQYKTEFMDPSIDDETLEALTQIILYNVLRRRKLIESIRREVNL